MWFATNMAIGFSGPKVSLAQTISLNWPLVFIATIWLVDFLTTFFMSLKSTASTAPE